MKVTSPISVRCSLNLSFSPLSLTLPQSVSFMVTEGVQEMCEQTYRGLLEAKQQFTADIEEVCECRVFKRWSA